METITIKHFVNKDLKPRNENGKLKYSVYVQVIVLQKNLRFKSNNNFFEYLSEDELNNELAQSILKNEKEVIERIVRDLIKNDKKDLITSKNLNLYSQNLNDTIDNNFSKFLSQEREKTGKFIPNVLFASYREVNEVIYFYNDDSPLTTISENLHYCLNAIQAIYDKTNKKLFYVYDLFFGEKKKEIESCINYSIDFDHDETEKMMKTLRNLVTL